MNKLVYIYYLPRISYSLKTVLFPLWDPPTISDGTGFTPTLVPTWERGRREIDSPSLSRFSLNRRTACLKREWRLGRLNTPPFEGELSAVRRLHLLLLQVEHTRQRRRFPSIRSKKIAPVADFHRLTNDTCLTLSPPLVFVPSIRRRASTSSINNRNGWWAAKTRGPIHPNVNIGQTTSSWRGWPVASRSGTRSSSPAFSRFLPFPPIFIPLVFITRLLEVSIFKGSFSQ